jgi:predicted Fe-Mo cluster-binding NifX family protein
MVKICITAVGPKLDSATDPRFGRCAYFLILDEKGKLLKAIPNKGVEAMRGAGVTAAQIVADQGVKIVITGNVGPNAYMVLTQSGTKIFPEAFNITAEQAFELYKQGKLKEIDSSQARGFGPGFGRGLGRGFGQGKGRGRNR